MSEFDITDRAMRLLRLLASRPGSTLDDIAAEIHRRFRVSPNRPVLSGEARALTSKGYISEMIGEVGDHYSVTPAGLAYLEAVGKPPLTWTA